MCSTQTNSTQTQVAITHVPDPHKAATPLRWPPPRTGQPEHRQSEAAGVDRVKTEADRFADLLRGREFGDGDVHRAAVKAMRSVMREPWPPRAVRRAGGVTETAKTA
jgi:hypothetical protein